MNIETTQSGHIVLTPSDGFVLTQASDVSLQDRLFNKTVALAASDNPSNWKEITCEEAEAMKQQMEAKAEEEMKKAMECDSFGISHLEIATYAR